MTDRHPGSLDLFHDMVHLLNSAYDSVSSTFRRGVIRVLAAGPVPQHIAFVMDGNRRYARQRNMAIKQGHTDGFYALRQVRVLSIHLFVWLITRRVRGCRCWKYVCDWG